MINIMTNDDFKKLLDSAIKPLQQGLDEVRSGLDEVRTGLNEVKNDLDKVKNGLDEVRKNLDGVKEELKEVKDIQEKRVLPPLIYIETTVKSYADRYVTNEDHIGRLDKRLNVVEKNLGILPPEDLRIPSFE